MGEHVVFAFYCVNGWALTRVGWNAVIRRLEHGARFTEYDCAALARLTRQARFVKADQVLVCEGESTASILVMLEGWACRWKVLSNGLRQITDLILPGDMDYPHQAVARCASHSVSTLSNCVVAEIPAADILATMDDHPLVRRAVRWSTLQADSILREALVNNGRRQAPQRIAHLICELIARLLSAGAIDRRDIAFGFEWPMTQVELSDLTGMTNVHANRTIMAMRKEGLFALSRSCMRVPDLRRLEAFSEFRPDYLHLDALVQHRPSLIE